MKKFPFISMFMALFTFAIACTPEPVEMTLSVTPAQLEYTAEGGVQSVTVSASHATWSAVSGAEWCDVNLPGKIENNASVAFTVEPNTGEERTTTVTFTLGEKSATVTIRQLEAEVNPLDAIQSLYEVPAEGAEIRIGMDDTEDISFDCDPQPDWLHIDVGTSEDMSFSGISIVVFPNEEPAVRECVVTFSQAQQRKEVTIRQAGAEPYIGVTPDSLDVDYKAQQITLQVDSNVEFDTSFSEGCDWITYNTTNSLGIQFDVTENPASEPRQAQIIFSNTTAGVSASITVTQEGRPERPTSPPNNQIWYSTWGYGETPYVKSGSFDREIVSNVYYWDEKFGIITFDGDVTEVKDEGWAYDDRCTWIMLPPSVTKVGDMSFYKCSRLEKFIAPGLTEMGVQAFAETPKLADFDFSGPIKSIPSKCFYKSGFVDLTIPGHIKDIAGNEAFRECNSLQNVVFEEGVESVSGTRVFYKSSTTSVKFPTTLKSLGEYVFCINSGLSSVEWGGLEYIGENCFSGTGFTELSIPSTVKIVGGFGFSQCESLTKLTVAADSIGSFAFYLNPSLVEITIEPTTTKYADGLFHTCTGLESFRFPDHWKTTGEQVFESCSKLKNVDLNQIEVIDSESFQYCEGLISVHIPSSVRKLMPFAFRGCYDLESVTIDEGIETLYGSFSSAILEELTIPASVKWVGSSFYINKNETSKVITFKGECPSLVEDQDDPIFPVNSGSTAPYVPTVRVPLAYLEDYLAKKSTVLGYCEITTY